MRPIFSVLVSLLVSFSLIAQDAVVQGKTVKEWIAQLKSADARTRYLALAVLAEAGDDAVPAVKEVTRLLKDSQPLIRRGAAQTLGGLKEQAAAAAPALVLSLRDSDAGVRKLASEALVAIGDKAGPALVPMLGEKAAKDRVSALVVIEGLGCKDAEVVSAVGKAATKDGSVSVRRAAVQVLARIGPGEPDVVDFLAEVLHDKDTPTRIFAAQTLFNLGKESAPQFNKAATAGDPNLRLIGVQALVGLGMELDDKGILTLRKALGDTSARVRLVSVHGIGQLGTRAREFGGGKDLYLALIKLMEDKEIAIRRMAIYAMGQVGIDDKEELDPLAGGLKDKDASVRSATVEALSQYAIDDNPAEVHQHIIQLVLPGLRDPDRRVAFKSAELLVKEGPLAVKPLIEVVEKEKGKQRGWAAATLGEIGPPAAEAAVPALQRLAQDADLEVRQAALAALKKIQP